MTSRRDFLKVLLGGAAATASSLWAPPDLLAAPRSPARTLLPAPAAPWSFSDEGFQITFYGFCPSIKGGQHYPNYVYWKGRPLPGLQELMLTLDSRIPLQRGVPLSCRVYGFLRTPIPGLQEQEEDWFGTRVYQLRDGDGRIKDLWGIDAGSHSGVKWQDGVIPQNGKLLGLLNLPGQLVFDVDDETWAALTEADDEMHLGRLILRGWDQNHPIEDNYVAPQRFDVPAVYYEFHKKNESLEDRMFRIRETHDTVWGERPIRRPYDYGEAVSPESMEGFRRWPVPDISSAKLSEAASFGKSWPGNKPPGFQF